MTALKTTVAILLLSISATSLRADFLILKSGYVIFGKIDSRGPQGIQFQRPTGTYPYAPGAIIREYEASRDSALANQLLPGFGPTIDRLGKRAWTAEMKQIPSTVIGKGILKNVPYLSFRFGIDYEANFYGDPEHPACIEIGFYRSLLKSPEAKRNCIELVTDLFSGTSLEAHLKSLNLERDLQKAGDWTIEVTPPDGDDSFGGWWISIYSEPLLNASRATAKELSVISTPTSQIRRTQADDSWTTDDLKNARPSLPLRELPTYSTRSSETPASGSVYVKGYYRKDGTYVRPHRRKR